jgi:hypothetical protein
LLQSVQRWIMKLKRCEITFIFFKNNANDVFRHVKLVSFWIYKVT